MSRTNLQGSMASTATDPIPVPSCERPHFQNGSLEPAILLCPTNLPLDWCDKQDGGYLSSHISRTTKQEKITSITDKLRKVFKKKERISHSSDRSLGPERGHEQHRNADFSTIGNLTRSPPQADFKGDRRRSEVYIAGPYKDQKRNEPEATDRTDAVGPPGSLSIPRQEGEMRPQCGPEISNDSELPTAVLASEVANGDKKNVGLLLNASKNKFKSSLQLFARTFKKAKHRDRYLSESPSLNPTEGAPMQYDGKYFHYNTVNADDFKEIFQGTSPRVAPLGPISLRAAGSTGNVKVKVTAVEKKNRFVVSTAARNDDSGRDWKTRRPTMMAQLLIDRHHNHHHPHHHHHHHHHNNDNDNNYNTVGPQDNRDRRPSVTLNDFLEMYKEKNFSDGNKKVKAERKRSISQSEYETCPHVIKANQPRKSVPMKPPIITVTSDDVTSGETSVISGAETLCACAQLETGTKGNDPQATAEKVIEGFTQHSIPEHQEVHHETSLGNFLPTGKTGRKNRFLSRCVVTEYKNSGQQSINSGKSCSAECSPALDPLKMAPAYDHSLTVSGYPRRNSSKLLAKISGPSRRLSEPDQDLQRWPELKKFNEVTTKYRKVPANSLGIDIPTDEFQNKLLVWIDKKRGTKILPLPHAEHEETWNENRDENSSVCFMAKRYKCYNVMPNSGKLVLFDSQLPVTAAFEAFTFNRVRSAPIWDSKKKQLTGMLTVSDFIEVLLICADHPELFEKITEQKISDWKSLIHKTKLEANKNLEFPEGRKTSEDRDTSCLGVDDVVDDTSKEADEHNVDNGDKGDNGDNGDTTDSDSADGRTEDFDTSSVCFEAGLISVESDDSLYDAISVLRTFGFHRVLVMDYSDNDPLYILTYKRILYFIYVMMDTINIPPFMACPIKDLNVGTFSNLVTIKYGTTLREALTLLQWRSVSAIPVLDENGRVIDLYTKEDVMNLVYNNNFTQLNSSIEEIFKDKRRVFEGLFKCKKTDSLMAVVQYFISSKAHRLVITTDDNLLEGIISLSDVVNFMVLGSQSDDQDLIDLAPC